MRIAVAYQDKSLDFEIAEDRLVGQWSGPRVEQVLDIRALARNAFEEPSDFPALRKAVVPGDRVVVPLDPSTSDLDLILETMASTIQEAEVEGITVVSTAPEPLALPAGVSWRVHDPDDRTQIAYLASTKEGRRVYLNRYLTDADLVVPIGTLGYDGTLGYRGPWSVIYPGLSDRETLGRYQGLDAVGVPNREEPSASLVESSEVTWLLGCQFQVGVLPAISGTSKIVAGLESAVRTEGAIEVDRIWSFEVEERADVVVVGIGAPDRPTSIADLAQGLATATRLVRRGGKLVILSRAQGEIGPALRRISGAENPRTAINRLRGHEADPDYLSARRLAESIAWADVYLHSALDPDLVEDLALIPLDRPEEARKLAESAPSCILISQADRTRAIVTRKSKTHEIGNPRHPARPPIARQPTEAAWIDRTSRVRLEIHGPDRAKFLHNLTTNDVKRLPEGTGHESFVTSPQGKTLALRDPARGRRIDDPPANRAGVAGIVPAAPQQVRRVR